MFVLGRGSQGDEKRGGQESQSPTNKLTQNVRTAYGDDNLICRVVPSRLGPQSKAATCNLVHTGKL